MRVVEREMIQALKENRNWKKDNTEVVDGKVYLFGNHIATLADGCIEVNEKTLARWPTLTTKSRLKALTMSFPKKV